MVWHWSGHGLTLAPWSAAWTQSWTIATISPSQHAYIVKHFSSTLQSRLWSDNNSKSGFSISLLTDIYWLGILFNLRKMIFMRTSFFVSGWISKQPVDILAISALPQELGSFRLEYSWPAHPYSVTHRSKAIQSDPLELLMLLWVFIHDH